MPICHCHAPTSSLMPSMHPILKCLFPSFEIHACPRSRPMPRFTSTLTPTFTHTPTLTPLRLCPRGSSDACAHGSTRFASTQQSPTCKPTLTPTPTPLRLHPCIMAFNIQTKLVASMRMVEDLFFCFLGLKFSQTTVTDTA